MINDIVIIGAGVSGMTSAIYLKRAGVNPVLIEMKRPGGQINFASSVENFPSYINVTGRELSNKIYEQVTSLGVEYIKDEVVNVFKEDEIFVLYMKNNEKIFAKNIIIATGKKIKKLDIPNVNSYLGLGLSYCATCDGMFFKDKDVLVVGDTNKAIEETIYLSNICKKVYVIASGSDMTCDSFYKEKIDGLENVEVIYNSVLKDLVKEDVLVGAIILDKNGVETTLDISGCFAYVGYLPNSELFSSLVKLNGDNYIIVDENKETSCKGVYAVGDVTDTKVYQLVTACGDAAIAVSSYLSSR